MTGSNDNGELVAFDPVTIATLITTILPVNHGLGAAVQSEATAAGRAASCGR
jgi:hypothetical protein